jgi:hypothetical protein
MDVTVRYGWAAPPEEAMTPTTLSESWNICPRVAKEKKKIPQKTENLGGFAALEDAAVGRFFGHICSPHFKRLYLLFERIGMEMDIEFFYIAYLRMLERSDTLDGFSHD